MICQKFSDSLLPSARLFRAAFERTRQVSGQDLHGFTEGMKGASSTSEMHITKGREHVFRRQRAKQSAKFAQRKMTARERDPEDVSAGVGAAASAGACWEWRCPRPPESYIYPLFFPVSKRLGPGFACRLGREGHGRSSGRAEGAK